MYRLLDAHALCYRIFDVADGIDLERCRTLITEGGAETKRLKLAREGSEFIQLSTPPLAVELGARTLLLGGQGRDVSLSARVHDDGALAVVVNVPIPSGTTLDALIPFADELYDSKAVDALAAEECARLRTLLGPAMESPHLWEQNEGYTVLFVRRIEGDPTAKELFAEPVLARLILGEAKADKLSESETREVLDQHFAYTDRDLAVIEWSASFIYEPTGSEDIVDLLEVANAQLLELRYYDSVLDRELGRVYDTIGKKRGGSILYSPYRQLLRDLMLTLIELSEFIERVENALKIVGDVYLARVYESAVRQLRISKWTEQVTRKHRLLQQTYGLLKGEVDNDRALTLEVMVVGLIVLEILIALLQVAH
jgi:hypothetical protein